MYNLNDYKEHEIKVLNVDIESVTKKLEEIGAKKVYDDFRTIITLDTEDKHFLNQKKIN